MGSIIKSENKKQGEGEYSKPVQFAKWLLMSLTFAISYYVFGYISNFYSIEPDFPSPIWLPSGIALGIIIIKGYKYLPAIFFGALFLNFELSNQTTLLNNALINSMAIALGASLQAIAGSYLIKKVHKSDTFLLDNEKEILTILLIGGVVSCLINATIGPLSLYFLNIINFTQLPYTIATWWVGDTIGVFIMTPLILILFNNANVEKKRKVLTSTALIFIIFTISQMFFVARKSEIDKNKVEFEALSNDILLSLQSKLKEQQNMLNLVKQEFEIFGILTPKQFDSIAKNVVGSSDILQALEWVPVINKKDRSKFERKTKEIYPNYNLTEKNNGHLSVAKERNFYYPVYYVYPYKENKQALGYDLGSNKKRLESLIKSQNTGAVVSTNIIKLVQKNKDKEGFLLICPVYKNNINNNPSSTKSIQGFIVGVMHLKTLIDFATNKYNNFNKEGLQLKVFENMNLLNKDSKVNKPFFVANKNLVVADKNWIFSLQKPNYSITPPWNIWFFLMFSMFFAGILSSFIMLITGRSENIKRLVKKMAQYDPITGLLNRASFERILNVECSRAKRYSKKMAVFFIDIDDFKNINDSRGHIVGDKLLNKFSSRISSALRKEDIIARLGGDEFAIILRDISKSYNCSFVAEKIIKKINEPLLIEKYNFNISCSIGIAILTDDYKNEKEILRQADIAMYKAKKSGKNNYKYFNEKLAIEVNKNLKVINSVNNGMKNNEFEFLYQPIFNKSNKEIVGVESLIRWSSKEFSKMPPNEFLPIIEQSHLIAPFGRWIINKAFQEYSEMLSKIKNKNVKLHINLSPKQLQDSELIKNLINNIIKYKINPSLLFIEVTETTILENQNIVSENLKQLNEAGINLAIDDFGANHSSFINLKSMLFNTIKIDKSFMKSIGTKNESESDKMMLKSIIDLCHNVGLFSVVEGVESIEQITFLNSTKCNYIQGFYLQQPLTKNKVIDLINGKNIENKIG